MASKVHEHGLATHRHLIQIEDRFLALLGQDVSTPEDLDPLYDAYTTFFWPLFPSVPEEVVQNMNLAGRLYEKHLILLDRIIDSDVESHFHPLLYLESTFLLQQSLAILYRYFPQSSPFWDEFQHHQQEFTQAILLEKTLQDGKLEQPYDFTTFKRIAAGKSAMAKCGVAALAILTHMPEKLKTLYDIFDEFAVYMQFYDDYTDWKQDLKNKQYSYLLRHFLAEMGIQSEQPIRLPDEKALRRRFFSSQTLQTAIDDMLSRLEHLLQAPEFTECKDWLDYLSFFYREIKILKSHLYSMGLRCRQIKSLPKNISFIDKALWFLSTFQTVEGAWYGFWCREPGEGTSWVTGYIASSLLPYPTTYHLLDHATRQLRQDQLPEGGWAWHRQTIMDADSTATCLSFLASRLSLAEVQQAIAALCLFQRADGGFCSYRQHLTPSMDTDNSSGWCMSHVCVTDVAVIALCLACQRYPQLEPMYRSVLASAVEYLLQQQQGDGRWHSYWWHGNIYATTSSIRALQMAARYSEKEQEIQEAQQRGRTFLLQAQLPNGGWGAYPTSECCPLQTALALQAFGGGLETEYQSVIEAACRYLEQSQQPNGCWHAATPVLRYPWPDDTHPWDWTEDIQSGYECGRVVPDQFHVLTTATVLRALPLFYEFIHDKQEKTLQEEAI